MTVFLVTGVTGNLGSAALRSLLGRVPTPDVRVLVRTDRAASQFAAQGLTAFVADYSDSASLDAAFTGAERVIFVSSPVLDPSVRSEQHRTVVESAVTAGVRHVVYTSGMGARHDPGHSAAEDALAESGMNHAILRNALYTDAFVDRAITQARAGATITSASSGQSLTTASIADLGEAAATASFTMPKKTLWELRGPRWDFSDMAAALAVVLGRPISHEEVSDADTGPFAVLFPLIRRGVFASESPDLAELLSRAPANIGDVANEMAGLRDHEAEVAQR
ncbi:MAG TPA: NAD(P)H-binding protein [Plantibacter sp.]|uniref:NAD(P)H-binding protein n=1 Tax=unclassified Plantibacter TaxID=2624265 RepID=UPI002CF4658A|nr:NAD(P)H-binding protein [Plantibacter sp.]